VTAVRSHPVRTTVAAVILVIVLGVAILYAARAQTPPVAVTSSAAPTATATVVAATATATPAATPSPRPSVTAAPGLCSNPQMTTRAVVERYFELSTSKDARAVSDCFAASWRARFVRNPSWDEVATQWASAGPATNLRITYGDTVKGCDRYEVAAQMATGHPIGQSGSEFLTVGPEGGTPRIFEMGTALVNPQLATTTCR